MQLPFDILQCVSFFLQAAFWLLNHAALINRNPRIGRGPKVFNRQMRYNPFELIESGMNEQSSDVFSDAHLMV